MGIDLMSCIKAFCANAHDNKVLIKPPLSSLLDRKRTAFYPYPMLLEHARLLTIWFSQKAGRVCYTLGNGAILEVMRNTPPQVDTSTYRNRRKSKAGAVGKKRQRLALTPFVVHRNNGNKPKPGEKKPDPKPDKKKSKPRREGDRDPREPREPNTKEIGYFHLM